MAKTQKSSPGTASSQSKQRATSKKSGTSATMATSNSGATSKKSTSAGSTTMKGATAKKGGTVISQGQSSGTGKANAKFNDQEMMKDVLSSQKFITDGYNTFANECATPKIKNEFMKLLQEEHKIQNDVFLEMQKRGWYTTEAADQNKVNQAKQKFSGQTF